MSCKKLGSITVAMLAMGTLLASVSQAQVWKVAGSKLASGQSREASAKNTGTFVVASKLLGQPFKITWTTLSSREGKLVQSGSGASGVSTLTGKLVFSGVTIDEPVGCKPSSSLETVALVGTAVHGSTAETAENVYVKVVPKEGEAFMTFKVSECAAAGSYQLKGNFYVLAKNKTGVEAAVQEGTTSGAINSSQGGGLSLGKEPALMEGTIDLSLADGSVFSLLKE